MEIVGLRKPKKPAEPEAEAEVAKKPIAAKPPEGENKPIAPKPPEVAKKPIAAKPPEGENKLTGPPARPTGPIQKPSRPKRPLRKSEKKNFELNIVSSGTNAEGEEFSPGDLVELEVMGFVTKARITSFYQAKEKGEVWASYAPTGEETWLGGCIQASQLSRPSA